MRAALLVGALVVASCGGQAAPQATNNVIVAPVDAGPVVAPPPPSVFDVGLPKNAVFLASVDGQALIDLLAQPDTVNFVKRVFEVKLGDVRFDELDRTRPIHIALVGLTDEQRAFLAAPPITDAKSAATAIGAQLTAFMFRIVIPVKDLVRGRAMVEQLAAKLPKDSQTQTAVADDGKNLVVLDAVFGEKPQAHLAVLRAQVSAGHADPPSLGPNELVHVAYSPFALVELAEYGKLEFAANVANGREQIARSPQDLFRDGEADIRQMEALFGGGRGMVDLFARRRDSTLDFEARTTTAVSQNAPPAEAWKPAPSFGADGKSFITYSRSFVDGWKLPGDPPDATLTNSTAAETATRSGAYGLIAAMPMGIPITGRLLFSPHGFPDSAFARFERFGTVLDEESMHVDIGLFAKDVKPTEAACILATKPCLKVGQVAPFGAKFVRLLPVEGTTALALALAYNKEDLAGLKLRARTAGPIEMVVQHKTRDTEIPWISSGQHLELSAHREGDIVRAELLAK